MKVLSPKPSTPPASDAGIEAEPAVHHPTIIPEYCGNETLLLVDDEAMIRDLLAFALERYGYRVLVAIDGEDAIRIADAYRAPIHLVLSDVVMPKRNGVSLSQDLRRWYPGIGVLLMSGFPDGQLAALNLEEELTFFIPKPFSIEQLLAAVRAALDWRPKHQPSEGA